MKIRNLFKGKQPEKSEKTTKMGYMVGGSWMPSWGTSKTWVSVKEDGVYVHGRRLLFADEANKGE